MIMRGTEERKSKLAGKENIIKKKKTRKKRRLIGYWMLTFQPKMLFRLE
jgi:hypothetical protein